MDCNSVARMRDVVLIVLSNLFFFVLLITYKVVRNSQAHD